MSEHRVTFTEVPAACEDSGRYGGVLIRILPPVQLNSDAVARYLTSGGFLDGSIDPSEGTDDVKDVALLGSTSEQTTIYASIAKEYEAGSLARDVANDTVRLLQFMGATATIDHPPAPDA